MGGIYFHSPDAIEELTFDDDFTGTNGDPPNVERWSVAAQTATSSYQIYNNKLRQAVSAGGDIYLENIIETFPDDFDIQIDWDLPVPAPSGEWWLAELRGTIISGPNTNWMWAISRGRLNGSQTIDYRYKNPSTGYNQFSNTSTSGKFRLERIGTHCKAYHDIGASWVNQFNLFPDSAGTVEISVNLISAGTVAPTVDWDNLISV